MKNVILGTAGHIDHGKTTLIKALTGRDTDSLKEEKQRGISINLGFTYFDLPSKKKSWNSGCAWSREVYKEHASRCMWNRYSFACSSCR